MAEKFERLKKYDEAMKYYDKADIGTYFYDDLYCKANLYEKIGNYEKADELFLIIAEKLRQKGFDVDAEMAVLPPNMLYSGFLADMGISSTTKENFLALQRQM